MTTFFEMKKNALKALEECITIAANHQCTDAKERLEVLKKELKAREMTIIVIGEARRGKSSLLNALLNEAAPLFPVDLDVCTNVVTTVRYGEQEMIQVVYAAADGEAPRTQQISRAQIRDYVCEQGNPDNYRDVVRLDIAIPNELLKMGIVFVDTPGVGSLNVRHAETTYSYLPYAELMLFVSDCTGGLSASELDFFRNSYGYCKNFLCPMTMKDANPSFQNIVDDNRSKLSSALQLPPEDIQIIPVSNTNKQAYLKSGSEWLYKASNFETLEASLWNMITKTCTEKLILPYLYEAQQEINTLAENAKLQIAALEDSSVIQTIVGELNSLTLQLEELRSNGAAWRSNLSLFCNTLHNNISPKIQQISQDANRLLDTAAKRYDTDICKPKNYQKVGEDLCHLVNNGICEIYRQIDSQVDAQLQSMNETLQISLTRTNQSNELIPVTNIQIDLPKQKFSDKMLNAGRSIGMQTMGGRAIGGVLGGVAGGAVFVFAGMDPGTGVKLGFDLGSQIGSSLAMARGAFEVMGKYDQVDAAHVKKELNFLANAQITAAKANIDNYISVMRSMLPQAYEQQISRKQLELKQLKLELEHSLNAKKTENTKKRDSLQVQLSQLSALQKQLQVRIQTVEGAVVPNAAASQKMQLSDYDFL